MEGQRYMGRALGTLLLSPSPLLEIISSMGEGTELEPSSLNGTRSAPHLRLSACGETQSEPLGKLLSSSSDRQALLIE